MARPRVPTVYRCPVTVDTADAQQGEVRLLTSPPIHAARLTRLDSGVWFGRWVSLPTAPLRVYPDMVAGITSMAARISREAGREWRERFTGEQRIHIGQQKCPYRYADLCGRQADVGSIWCPDHWGGRRSEKASMLREGM